MIKDVKLEKVQEQKKKGNVWKVKSSELGTNSKMKNVTMVCKESRMNLRLVTNQELTK